MLKQKQVDRLRAAYRRGLRPYAAALKIDASRTTVERWYRQFAAEGVVRGARRPYIRRRYLDDEPLPVYSGPDLIGTAAERPPFGSGPEWIGKAA